MTHATCDLRSATRPPQTFQAWVQRAAPGFGLAALAFIPTGVAVGLLTPANAWNGDAHRSLAIQLPAMWVSIAIYGVIAALSALGLRGNRFAATVSRALAPTGILFAVLALWSGALWERPLRGTWWGWEPQSVCVLLLLFLYGGLAALRTMHDDPRRAERASALFALVGAANLPVLYLSIHWWDVARNGAAGSLKAPAATPAMLVTLGLVAVGFAAYAAFVALTRERLLTAEREWQACSAQLLKENTR